MSGPASPKVLTIAGVPPEKCAYALARYSRSPDSILESLEWVRSHDSSKFLESFYFQYGHASIADLGHVVVCLEGVSEIAATEAEDEQLWDGQARSSRYQNFSRGGLITPPDFDPASAQRYLDAASELLSTYQDFHRRLFDYYCEQIPCPPSFKAEAYKRNIAARAFDVARYLLPYGISTGVGQITSIRTLEKQIQRLRVSPYQEIRDLACEMAAACAKPPAAAWDRASATDPLAPTLAKYVDTDKHRDQATRDLAQWAAQNLPAASSEKIQDVDLLKPSDRVTDIVATLLYPVTTRPFRELYAIAESWSAERRREVIDVALRSRNRYDELLREFRGGPYVYDIVMDIGAYRDLHRHRRCQQFRQSYSTLHGWSTPEVLKACGREDAYNQTLESTFNHVNALPAPGSHYLLPFATRSRFLFKMDFAEAEYISRLRSGVKGHFSYRQVAWQMKLRMDELEPELGRLIQATPPWIEDPLER